MPQNSRSDIRHIFLSPRPSFALLTAAGLLGLTLPELRQGIADGSIVAVSTGMGQRVAREEMMALAMERWGLPVIEAALGEDAARVLPEAVRLVELRARVPRYLRDMLGFMARREGTSVDAVLTRELEGVASAQAEELGRQVPGFAAALQWP
ncbi:MAG TPA: hypothetical protein VF618_12525 [Thermoanaerobaculia bacterium]